MSFVVEVGWAGFFPSHKGRPATEPRLVAGLLYLQHAYRLSDLTLYRVMRMRLKAKGHAASPKAALEILAKVQRFTAYIGEKSFTGTTRTKPEQLDLFEALDIAKPV